MIPLVILSVLLALGCATGWGMYYREKELREIEGSYGGVRRNPGPVIVEDTGIDAVDQMQEQVESMELHQIENQLRRELKKDGRLGDVSDEAIQEEAQRILAKFEHRGH